jgi:hypothetical protein
MLVCLTSLQAYGRFPVTHKCIFYAFRSQNMSNGNKEFHGSVIPLVFFMAHALYELISA